MVNIAKKLKNTGNTYILRCDSPLGEITLESDGKFLIGLWFESQKNFNGVLPPKYKEVNLPIFKQTKRWLDTYFRGEVPDFMPPLKAEGSQFQKDVWEILKQIPYGKTMSYKEIAEKIAKQRGIPKMSAQAIGGAVGHNPISILVPCHRVVGANGNLTGYAGGLSKKIALLTLEKVNMESFFYPKKKEPVNRKTLINI